MNIYNIARIIAYNYKYKNTSIPYMLLWYIYPRYSYIICKSIMTSAPYLFQVYRISTSTTCCVLTPVSTESCPRAAGVDELPSGTGMTGQLFHYYINPQRR